jgi:hypothetical protein
MIMKSEKPLNNEAAGECIDSLALSSLPIGGFIPLSVIFVV